MRYILLLHFPKASRGYLQPQAKSMYNSHGKEDDIYRNLVNKEWPDWSVGVSRVGIHYEMKVRRVQVCTMLYVEGGS